MNVKTIETEFFNASFDGNLETVRKLLPYVDINESKGLASALMNHKIDIVKELIEYGADIHIEDDLLLKNAHNLEDNYKLASYLVFERNIVLSEELKKYLMENKKSLIVDLIAKRDFGKQLQQEIKQIPESNNNKKVIKL